MYIYTHTYKYIYVYIYIPSLDFGRKKRTPRPGFDDRLGGGGGPDPPPKAGGGGGPGDPPTSICVTTRSSNPARGAAVGKILEVFPDSDRFYAADS